MEGEAQPFSAPALSGSFGLLLSKLWCLCSSPDEATVRLKQKVSDSLKQALAKLKLTENAEETKGETTNPPWPLGSHWRWS